MLKQNHQASTVSTLPRLNNYNDSKQEELDDLSAELWQLFLSARTYRQVCGGTKRLENYLAWQLAYDDRQRELNKEHDPSQPSVCLLDLLASCKDENKLDRIAELLATVKIGDYLAVINRVFAPVGSRPMAIKSTTFNPEIYADEHEMTRAAQALYDYIDNIIKQHQVTIEEIPEAFDFNSIIDMVEKLTDVANQKLMDRIQRANALAEDRMALLFTRINLMKTYQHVLADIAYAPIGIIWCDHNILQPVINITKGKVTRRQEQLAGVNRIDPCYFWNTPDHTTDRKGRAVFTVRRLDFNTLESLMDKATLSIQRKAIKAILYDENNKPRQSYTNQTFQLVTDNDLENSYLFDVLVCRGSFQAKQLAVLFPNEKFTQTFVDAELWYLNGTIIFADLLPDYYDKYGVFTTNFRPLKDTSSLWGYSLFEFIDPIVSLYQDALKQLDIAIGKSNSSITMVDISVIDQPEKYFKTKVVDGKTETYFDLSGDSVFLFSSNNALSNTFTGIPIKTDQLPHNMNVLFPAINFFMNLLDTFTGLPSIMTTGNPDSSAVRTDQSYATAYRNASSQLAAILGRGKESILLPMLRFFYYLCIDNNDIFKNYPINDYPEIMLDEQLAFQLQYNQNQTKGLLQDLGPFANQLSPDIITSIINQMGKQVYGLKTDLIPGINPLSTSAPAQPAKTL